MEPDDGMRQDFTRIRQLLRPYARKGLKAMGQPKYQKDDDPRTSGSGVRPQHALRRAHVERPRTIFVNSMSDLLHHDVPGGLYPWRLRGHCEHPPAPVPRCSPSAPSDWPMSRDALTGREISGWA
jgi:hypothetical protein